MLANEVEERATNIVIYTLGAFLMLFIGFLYWITFFRRVPLYFV